MLYSVEQPPHCDLLRLSLRLDDLFFFHWNLFSRNARELVLFRLADFCLVETSEDLCVPLQKLLFSTNVVELGNILLNLLFSKNAL